MFVLAMGPTEAPLVIPTVISPSATESTNDFGAVQISSIMTALSGMSLTRSKNQAKSCEGEMKQKIRQFFRHIQVLHTDNTAQPTGSFKMFKYNVIIRRCWFEAEDVAFTCPHNQLQPLHTWYIILVKPTKQTTPMHKLERTCFRKLCRINRCRNEKGRDNIAHKKQFDNADVKNHCVVHGASESPSSRVGSAINGAMLKFNPRFKFASRRR